jgi:tRNA (guanine37-N1)-methyltransferase
MLFRIFSLHTDIFESFTKNALIARGVAKEVIKFELINWREKFGIGKYKQVDDSPFGGGSGMVIMAGPIISAINDNQYTINQEIQNKVPTEHHSFLPNNANFFDSVKSGKNQSRKVKIMMTPRGFPINQKTVEWLAKDFDQISILCGRYEGFDARVNDEVDLELSIGNFVLNGGEVGAMCLVEAVSRLVPDFITKNNSVLHDSFSSGLNEYKEFQFENSKEYYKKNLSKSIKNQTKVDNNLFDNNWWIKNILPQIEHPQYTRPEVFNGISVPAILKTGDHAKIQKWRTKWY